MHLFLLDVDLAHTLLVDRSPALCKVIVRSKSRSVLSLDLDHHLLSMDLIMTTNVVFRSGETVVSWGS